LDLQPDLRNGFRPHRHLARHALEYGIVGWVVPVRDHRNRVLAAINCAGEAARVDLETLIRTRLPALREASNLVSAALARHPALNHSIMAVRAGG
jgi:IclR family transcriptional regulator, pca regulon regulatory protein